MNKPSETPSGQPVMGQWAEQQKRGMAKQEQAEKHNAKSAHPQLSPEEQRKLEEDIARDASQASPEEQGGAGSPQSSRMEPEKQGGMGRP